MKHCWPLFKNSHFHTQEKLIILSQLTQPSNLPSKVITLANQEKWPIG